MQPYRLIFHSQFSLFIHRFGSCLCRHFTRAARIAYGWLTVCRTYPRAVRVQGFFACRPRSGISCAECRHGFSLPSAVTRMRRSVAQKRWLIGESDRIFPFHPGIRYNSATPSFGTTAAAPAGRAAPRPQRETAHAASPRITDRHESLKRHHIFPFLRQLRTVPESHPRFTPPSSTAFSFVPGIRRPRRVQTGQRIRERAAARQRRKFILI